MFPRGFKSWCENVATQQRKKLGLNSSDPLDPFLLARTLEVTIWKPEDVPDLDSRCLQTLLQDDPDSWSAITLTLESNSLIIFNSSHSPGRINSDLTHELSHILLGHNPARVDVSEDQMLLLNTYDDKQEKEADWLAGSLLLPRAALVDIHQRQLSTRDATSEYGVSEQMLNYRTKITGVEIQFRRARKKKVQ